MWVELSTKADISDEINRILGLEVDFSKMSREDLEKLKDFFGDPSKLITLGIKQTRAKVRSEILDRPLKEFLERPLIELLEGEAAEGKADRGPLGLGILPSIMRRASRVGLKAE